MGRFLILIGIVLIFVAVGLLIYALTGIDSERNLDLIAPYLCDVEEELVQNIGGYVRTSTGSGREISWECVQPAGASRDVSVQVVVIMAGVFVVPFLIGLVMTMIGGGMATRNASKRMMQHFTMSPATSNMTIDLRQGSVDYENLPPQAQEALDMFRDHMADVFGGTANQGTLTERLQEVEDAYQRHLITKEEYDRTRAAIVDRMDD